MRLVVAVVVALIGSVLMPPVSQAASAFQHTVVTPGRAHRVPRTMDTSDEPDSGTETNPHHDSSPAPAGRAPSRPDGAVQRSALTTSTATPGVSAPGAGFTGVYPPDPVGEAGTTHFVQMVNSVNGSIVLIVDKSTGAKAAQFHLHELADGGLCANHAFGDGVPLFDQLAGRWLLMEFAFFGGDKALCLYVSSAADPVTSDWHPYRIDAPSFPDYPKIGMTPDAYYIGTNEDDGPALRAVDRADVLAGDPIDVIYRPDAVPRLRGFTFDPIAPIDLDGPNALPPGTPGMFIRHVDDEANSVIADPTEDHVEIWEFAPDFTTPSSSTVTGPIDVSTSEFDSRLCGLVTLDCIKQKKTKRKLDPLREPVMQRPLIRVLPTKQAIVATWAVDADGDDTAGVRWVEIDRAPGTAAGGWPASATQDATFAPGSDSRWIPSIAMNGAESIALGYSVSSKQTYPSIRYTGRLAGDTAGQMTAGETTLVAGKHSQKATDRWGDYSAMSVDPSDDETFWYTNGYTGKHSRWKTQIGSFTLSP